MNSNPPSDSFVLPGAIHTDVLDCTVSHIFLWYTDNTSYKTTWKLTFALSGHPRGLRYIVATCTMNSENGNLLAHSPDLYNLIKGGPRGRYTKIYFHTSQSQYTTRNPVLLLSSELTHAHVNFGQIIAGLRQRISFYQAPNNSQQHISADWALRAIQELVELGLVPNLNMNIERTIATMCPDYEHIPGRIFLNCPADYV